MTAILTKDPLELEMMPLVASLGLDRIVRRCLEKSPDLRFQSTNDLAFALETFSTTSTARFGVRTSRRATLPGRGCHGQLRRLVFWRRRLSWIPRNVPEEVECSL